MSEMNGDGYPKEHAEPPLVTLALEALADPDFYERLKVDPAAAAQSIGIELTEAQVEYLRSDVHWVVLDAHLDEMRAALHITAARAGW